MRPAALCFGFTLSLSLACLGPTEEPKPEDPVEDPAEDPAEDPVEDPELEPAPEPPAGVKKVGDNHWELKRRFMNKCLEDPSRLADAKRKGKGWELLGIRKHSDAWWMGLHRGDLLLRVNNMPLETDAEVLAAYAALKDEDHLVLKLKRKGEPRKYTYDIVGK